MENLANWANWDWTLGPQWTKQAKQFQTFPPPQQPLAPNCSTDNQCFAATPGPSCGVCTVCQRNSPPVTWKTRLAFVCLPTEYGNFDSPYSCGKTWQNMSTVVTGTYFDNFDKNWDLMWLHVTVTYLSERKLAVRILAMCCQRPLHVCRIHHSQKSTSARLKSLLD